MKHTSRRITILLIVALYKNAPENRAKNMYQRSSPPLAYLMSRNAMNTENIQNIVSCTPTAVLPKINLRRNALKKSNITPSNTPQKSETEKTKIWVCIYLNSLLRKPAPCPFDISSSE